MESIASLFSLVNFNMFIVTIVVFFISYFYLTSRRARNLPPGPFALPIIGNLPFALKYQKTLFKEVINLKPKYGDVISLYMGNVLLVVISSYQKIKESIVDLADSYSDRSDVVNENIYGHYPNVRPAMIMSSGERWKTIRKKIVVALRDMGVGKKSLEDKITEEARFIIDEFSKHEAKPYDMSLLINYAVSNIINGVVFGERFEYSDEEFINLIEQMIDYFGIISMVDPTIFSPLTTTLLTRDFDKGNKMLHMGKTIVAFYNKKIQEHKDSFNRDEIRDIIDIAIAADMDDSSDSVFDAGTIFGIVDDLFFAGSETTTTTLKWLFLQMLRYPDVQDKCYREIVEVFGNERPSMKGKDKCHYVNATLNENQRISNIAPLSIIHATADDTVVGGYEIPKGTHILYNLYAVHMDDENFPNAKEFKPERWLDENGKLISLDKYIPFGTGRRQCAGENLAKIERFLFFTVLLQQFKFLPEDDVQLPSDDEAKFGITLQSPRYKVIGIRR